MEEHLKIMISANHKFLFMVSWGMLAAIVMLRDGFRALKDSNKKEPIILFSFRNSTNNPFKGWIFIIFGSVILLALTIKLIIHFTG
jgi:hypothetical protein